MKLFFSLGLIFLVASPSYIKSLNNADTVALTDFFKTPKLALVFQADCSACQRQVHQLSCLESKYPVVLLGAFSGEKSLKAEYQKMKVSYPAYHVSSDIQSEMGISRAATPQILILSQKPKLLNIGLSSCEKLKKKITDI